METRNSRLPSPRKLLRLCSPAFALRVSFAKFRLANFEFRFSILVFFLLLGCGAPGEPVAPTRQIPIAINDLVVSQAGDAVQLTFTLPSKTISGERLLEPPAVEILRGTLKSDGSPDPKSFRVIFTIPGAMTENYTTAAEKLQFVDHIPSENLRARNAAAFAYRVRTRASRKRPSAESNTVVQRILPVPERITTLNATVTETAVELDWQAPRKNSDGEPVAGITEYHVYRGQLDAASSSAAQNDLSQAKWISPLTLLSSASASSFRDSDFDFGKTYLYTVRSTVISQGQPLESSDSIPKVVTPRDTFPPAVPQGIVANVVSPTPEAAPEVDLSWSINLETDLAGYRVYRSEQRDTLGQVVTSELLLSPAYRDTSVQPGHRYWYSVTSLDRSGNESAHSAPVAVDVSQPSS